MQEKRMPESPPADPESFIIAEKVKGRSQGERVKLH